VTRSLAGSGAGSARVNGSIDSRSKRKKPRELVERIVSRVSGESRCIID
jgi:hypothetical protein